MALDDLFTIPVLKSLSPIRLRVRGYFTANDPVILRHMPRETFEGSGEYKIYQYYEVESLQALLKMDFYKALEVGYIIRKCEYCGRYFLLKRDTTPSIATTLHPIIQSTPALSLVITARE